MKKTTLFIASVFFTMAIALVFIGRTEFKRKAAVPVSSDRKIVRILPMPHKRKG